MQTNLQKLLISDESSLASIAFTLMPGDRIFFYGDLGAGKSTFIRYLLRKHFNNDGMVVRSPTYTYYQQYPSVHHGNNSGESTVFHFDLYRIEDFSTIISIGGTEIFEDVSNIILIEWPELVEGFLAPTKRIWIKQIDNNDRTITIETL